MIENDTKVIIKVEYANHSMRLSKDSFDTTYFFYNYIYYDRKLILSLGNGRQP